MRFAWALCCWSAVAHAASGNERVLTPLDAIRTARIMRNPDAIGPANPDGAVAVSPDGRRYVIRLVRADVERNGLWLDLLAGSLQSLPGAVQHESVARLFSTGLGPGDDGYLGPYLDTIDYKAPLRWLDNENVAFQWSNQYGIRQVVKVNLVSHALQYLTEHPTQVGAFDINAAGTVLYNAQARSDERGSADPFADGFAVDVYTDAFRLFRGDVSGASQLDRACNTEWFVKFAAEPAIRKLRVAGRDIDLMSLHGVQLAPSAELALVTTAPTEIPDEWSRYPEASLRAAIAAARADQRAAAARNVQQLYVIDLRQGTSRPLWDAASARLPDMMWSPDSRSVLLAPTYLPPRDAGPAGLDGVAAAVVDVQSGNYEKLPITLPRLRQITLRWLDSNAVEISGRETSTRRQFSFKRSGGTWQLVEGGAATKQRARIRVELRQDLNTPPQLLGIDAKTGERRTILEPNSELGSGFTLGRVELLEGTLEGNVQWQGLLFHPPRHQQRRRYPLVIQSVYGMPPDSEFTLYGWQGGFGVGLTPIAHYPGQALAARGVLVLHLNATFGGKAETSAEAKTRQAVFEAVAKQLTAAGRVDGNRIGLLGFSRNGYWVEYALTHSELPFAAAVVADNYDPSYLAMTLLGYGDGGSAEALNGGPPFGDGLKSWLDSAPGFNADKIKAPLRAVVQQTGLFGALLKWEMFSRLRYLHKPAELYVMPDAEHGAHETQNPRQILAALEGSVDWFDFWLNGHEDPSPGKTRQYQRWRKLRELHRMSGGSLTSTSSHPRSCPDLGVQVPEDLARRNCMSRE